MTPPAQAVDDSLDRLPEEHQPGPGQGHDAMGRAGPFHSQLLVSLSHDLLAPLSAILGYADMLQEGVYGPLEGRQQRVVQRIASNARRLLSTINSLQDQAQIEAGTLKLRREVFVASSLVAAVENVMRRAAEAKGLDLQTQIAPELPGCLVGDPGRIQQMLLNLIENAIKFTSEGGVTVDLCLESNGFWAMRVCDTGPGIPPEVQGTLFEAFHPPDAPATHESEGPGLGLAIVKQLALLMGGDVHLASADGRGSCFTVLLPLIELEDKMS